MAQRFNAGMSVAPPSGPPEGTARELTFRLNRCMRHCVQLTLDLPADLARLHLPPAVDARLRDLLDRQDRGETLSEGECSEVEGLVDVAEFFSLLRLRSEQRTRR